MKIKKEFKNIGNFANVESANKIDNFDVLFNLDTKKYFKVYNKKKFVEKTITGDDKGVVYNFLIPFFNKNYTFLPELHYDTENYLFFDYYIDYSLPKASDFIDLSLINLRKILGITNNKNINLKPTVLFNEVISSFKKIYLNEKIYDPIPEDIKKIYDSIFNFNTNNGKLNYLTITPTNISLKDFVVKRNKNNKILDWKYVDIENFSIQPPRYIFNLEDDGYYPIYFTDDNYTQSNAYKKGGHDSINYKQILNLFEDNDIVYCFNKEWHVL